LSLSAGLHRTLVIGATGCIGAQVVEALVGQGASVRATRRWSSAPRASTESVEWVVADVEQPATMERAMAGCTAVVFAARLVEPPGGRTVAGRSLARAVGGLRNVLLEARAHNLHRLVYVSSALTLRPAAPAALTDEHDLDAPAPRASAAEHLAFWTELEVRKFVGLGLPIVIVNPALCLGPGARANPLVDGLRRGSVTVSSALSAVDVRDVARSIVAAADRGTIGARYGLGGHAPTFAELAAAIDGVTGVSRRRVPLPPGVLDACASLQGLLSARLPLDPETLAFARAGLRLDDRRARAELHHRPRPLEDTLRSVLGR